jgi:hypothetical protein
MVLMKHVPVCVFVIVLLLTNVYFQVVIVSNKFENVKLIERHRLVNSALQQVKC